MQFLVDLSRGKVFFGERIRKSPHVRPGQAGMKGC
jgi:hypothetical protein